MSKKMQTSLRRRPGLLFYPVPGLTECPLCGVGSPHEHNALEELVFSYGIKKGRASSNKKEFEDLQDVNEQLCTQLNTAETNWCESLEKWWAQATDAEKKRAYQVSIAADSWKAKRIRDLEVGVRWRDHRGAQKT